MLLRARTVVPVASPPIDNGAVLVDRDRIVAVGRHDEVRPAAGSVPVVDLGDAILLPGLVNAHCHLDYTAMAGAIPPPKSFPDWIKSLLTLKASWSYADYAASWLEGARMLVNHGVTTVADIEAVPELLPEVWTATPLRALSFLELTGVRSRRPPAQIVGEALGTIESLGWTARHTVALSPHAPYSTTPELLRLAAELARNRGWRLTTHVAESQPEFDMFMYRRGPLFDWLHAQRDMGDCGHGSPVRHLAAHGLLGPHLIAIHVNYLWDNDARLLGESGTHVVHCPRSHAYFGHRRFPRRELEAAGVNIALGTDSLVSTTAAKGRRPELDLFAEMRVLASKSSDLTPEQILRMATVNGAAALGLGGRCGEVSPGAWADLIAVPDGSGSASPCERLLACEGHVSASMIGGQWVVEPRTL